MGPWTEIELSTSSSSWLETARTVSGPTLRFNEDADIEISTPEMWFEVINERVYTHAQQNTRKRDKIPRVSPLPSLAFDILIFNYLPLVCLPLPVLVWGKEKTQENIRATVLSALIRVAQLLVLAKNIIAKKHSCCWLRCRCGKKDGGGGGSVRGSETAARNFICHSAEGTLGGFYSNISIAPLSG